MARRLTPEELAARTPKVPSTTPKKHPDFPPSAETVEAMKVHAAFIAKEMAEGRLVCKG